MGISELFDKAFDKLKELEPTLRELAGKAESLQRELNGFKSKLSEKDDRELFEIGRNSDNRVERLAVLEILKERGYEKNSDGKWFKNTQD